MQPKSGSFGVSIHIEQPPLALAATKVHCTTDPTTPGSICACGIATKDGISLTSVWAAVITPVLPATQSPPVSHTMVANPTQCQTINPYTGFWSFVGTNLVGHVPCNLATGSGANATFVVWCSFADDGGVEHPKAASIVATSAKVTNCDGSPNPCAERLVLARAGSATTVAVETAPREYQVKGQGARGPQASLVNTTWALALRSGGCGCAFAWDNGGDGIRVARVVLHPDSLISTEWNLTLVLKGRRAQYTCSALEWKVLGTNRLRRASGDDNMPATLIVTPV
jgi:hypothetical protein